MVKEFKKLEKETAKRNEQNRRSKWARGVGEYTAELLENIKNNEQTATTTEELKKQMLNGAQDWSAYSWGGCSLIYNADICEQLATPSEQKRTNNGEKRPNGREDWLDVQARALFQAASRILRAFNSINK